MHLGKVNGVNHFQDEAQIVLFSRHLSAFAWALWRIVEIKQHEGGALMEYANVHLGPRVV